MCTSIKSKNLYVHFFFKTKISWKLLELKRVEIRYSVNIKNL